MGETHAAFSPIEEKPHSWRLSSQESAAWFCTEPDPPRICGPSPGPSEGATEAAGPEPVREAEAPGADPKAAGPFGEQPPRLGLQPPRATQARPAQGERRPHCQVISEGAPEMQSLPRAPRQRQRGQREWPWPVGVTSCRVDGSRGKCPKAAWTHRRKSRGTARRLDRRHRRALRQDLGVCSPGAPQPQRRSTEGGHRRTQYWVGGGLLPEALSQLPHVSPPPPSTHCPRALGGGSGHLASQARASSGAGTRTAARSCWGKSTGIPAGRGQPAPGAGPEMTRPGPKPGHEYCIRPATVPAFPGPHLRRAEPSLRRRPCREDRGPAHHNAQGC